MNFVKRKKRHRQKISKKMQILMETSQKENKFCQRIGVKNANIVSNLLYKVQISTKNPGNKT